MFNYLTNTLYNKLPSELRAVIQNTTVVSSHGNGSDSTCTTSDTRDSNCNYITPKQKIYLLDTKEVFGSGSKDTAVGTTRQLDYYKGKSNADRIKVQRSSDSDTEGTAVDWWLRTANSETDCYYSCISITGSIGYHSAKITYGLSPAFRIG